MTMQRPSLTADQLVLLKSWVTSKGVWGGIAAVGGGVLAFFGYTISDADLSRLIELGSSIASSVGGIVAIYGRVKATKKIG